MYCGVVYVRRLGVLVTTSVSVCSNGSGSSAVPV